MPYVVIYDKKKCVGSGVCEAFAPEYWQVRKDGKAELVRGKEKEGLVFEREITDSELELNKSAANGCPPKCIIIIRKETGEKLAPDDDF